MERCWSLNAPSFSSVTGSKKLKGFALLTYRSVPLIWTWTISLGLYGSLVFSEPQGGCLFVCFQRFNTNPESEVLAEWPVSVSVRKGGPDCQSPPIAWVSGDKAQSHAKTTHNLLDTSVLPLQCLHQPASPKPWGSYWCSPWQQVVPSNNTNTHQQRKAGK